MDDFTLSLHRLLPAAGDLVWSPYSVASALALLATGARGTTREEPVRVLGAPPDGLRLPEAAALEGVEIAVANALWGRAGLTFEEKYERALAAFPGASARVADFAADPDGARRAINADVEKVTRALITDLLPPGAITAGTAAVLVNALYLKAAWRNPFGQGTTRPGPFHGPGGTREVPMMRRTGRMPYAQADGWRMATLAAEGGVVADVLLAPDGQDGGLPPAPFLRALREAARDVRVALALPRFRVEGRASLGGVLGALGVHAAFTDDADFSGMTPERVRVDRVEHKAVLDVDEAGFEGAAATAATMVLASFATDGVVDFLVDRPFAILVRHPATDAVYFAARVTAP